MLIFHGTQPANADSINTHGLRPPSAGGQSNWAMAPARSDLVYLSQSYPFFFGRKGGHPGVLAVEVNLDKLDTDLLLPDEDYIVLTGQVAGTERLSPHEVAKGRLEDFQSQRRDSLEKLGTCAYQGVVPKAAITRFCELTMEEMKASQLWRAAFDAEEISLDYHTAEGMRHRACTFWAFGDQQLPSNIKWSGSDRSLFRVW